MKSTIPCPYPGTCEFDDYRRSGNHLCMRVSCPYSLSARALMSWREKYLDEIGNRPRRDFGAGSAESG